MQTKRIGPTDHEQIASEYFGIRGHVTPLPGYIDSNAHIESDTGESYLLRIIPEPDTETIEFTQSVMRAAVVVPYTTPLPVPSLLGTDHQTLDDGRVALVNTWVEGTTFEDLGRPASGAHSIGRAAAEMVMALGSMPETHRRPDREWDLLTAFEVTQPLVRHVGEPAHVQLIEQVLRRIGAIDTGGLPMQINHNDFNEGNILLDGDDVVGVIDFGDANHTVRIGELAIACSYAMLDQDDPMGVATDVVAGYRRLLTIDEQEAACLFDLILARLATSACMAAWRLSQGIPPGRSLGMTWDLLNSLLTSDTDSLAAGLKARTF